MSTDFSSVNVLSHGREISFAGFVYSSTVLHGLIITAGEDTRHGGKTQVHQLLPPTPDCHPGLSMLNPSSSTVVGVLTNHFLFQLAGETPAKVERIRH